MPQLDPIFDEADKAIGEHIKGAPRPVATDPIFFQADKELTAAQEKREKLTKMEDFLRVSEPAGRSLITEAPMLGADVGAGMLASKGLTAAAKMVGLPAVGRFLTGAAGGLAKLPSLATSGAWQGALSSGINKLFGEENPVGTGAAVGGGVNALTGGIGGALFGNKISQETAQRAIAARAAGVPLVTGNVPGSSFAARLAGKVIGSTRLDTAEFTRHLMRSVGSDAEVLTGESLAAAKARLQGDPGNLTAGLPPSPGEFDKIAALARPITAQSAPGLSRELADIEAEAHNKYGLMQNPDEMRRVEGQIQNVRDGLAAGGITGDQLQAITAMNSGLSQHANGNTAGSYLAVRLKRALYNAAAQADPQTAKDLSLARNQYRNILMLEPKVEQLTDAGGLVDPAKLATRIRGTYGNFDKASDAAAKSGQTTSDLGALGEVGQRFGQQPVARPSLPAAVGLGAGLGTLGAEEALNGLPLYESLMHHPLLGLGLGAGTLGGLGASLPLGALQNSKLGTDFLLSRASRGAGPLLGGTNLLIPPAVTSQGSTAQPEKNWQNWLRSQAFLESPTGEASKSSSAKGYFQFIDSTAKEAQKAGLPNPQEGDYSSQAAATRAYIQKFYPKAADAISQGDWPTAVSKLAPVWPSLPGGGQPQNISQYSQWNKLLQGDQSP
jgi:hypothetical protein